MTKTDIAVKLGQYSTLLVASLLSFVCFSSTSVYLTTDNGLVTCSIDWDTEIVTCQGSSSDSNSDCVSDLTHYSQLQYNLSTDSSSCRNFLEDEIELLKYVKSSTSDNSPDSATQSNLNTAINGLTYSLSKASNIVDNASSLYQQLKSVDCSSCSGGVCPCSNQFAVIESSLSSISDSLSSLVSVTNYLDLISSVLGSSLHSGTTDQYYNRFNRSASGTLSVRSDYTLRPGSSSTHNILDLLNMLTRNLSYTQSSINNYLYVLHKDHIPFISTNVMFIATNTFGILQENREFFSFFRDEVSVRPVLEDWTPDDGGYYDFLTNYYIRVVNKDSSLSSTSKTNWLSRIETLLASLVFADSVESTNTVDVSSASSESSDIFRETLGGVSDVGSASSSQLSAFRDTSQNIVSSLRSISASFARVADPGTVHLVSLSSGSRDSSDSVSFETSDIKNLVEACHCVTTLCWCFSGLLLLYYFLHWTVKTSYSLLMFAWGVFSAIFKH